MGRKPVVKAATEMWTPLKSLARQLLLVNREKMVRQVGMAVGVTVAKPPME